VNTPEDSQNVQPPSNASQIPAEDFGNHEAKQSSKAQNFNLSQVEDKLNELAQLFHNKIADDIYKGGVIKALHEELQKYKNDQLSMATRPTLLEIIRVRDDAAKRKKALLQNADLLGPDQVFKELDGISEELMIVLDKAGISEFLEPDENYNPARHEICGQKQTPDRALHGKVAERVFLGYLQGEKILKRERVKVYVFDEGAKPEPQALQEPASSADDNAAHSHPTPVLSESVVSPDPQTQPTAKTTSELNTETVPQL